MKSAIFGHPIRRSLLGGNQIIREEMFTQPLESHFVTVGGAGAGKSSAVVVPNALRFTGSGDGRPASFTVVVDPKGELAWLTAPMRRRMGYEVVIIDPWNEVNRHYVEAFPHLNLAPEVTTPVNPLLRLRPDHPRFHEGLVDQATAVVERGEREHQPHFNDRAEALVMAAVADTVERGRPFWPAVHHMINSPPQQFARIIAAAKKREGRAYDYLRAFEMDDYTDELRDVFATTTAHLRFLKDPFVAQDLSTTRETLDFDDICGKPVTVYLIMPPDKFGSEYRRWMRLLLICLIRAVLRARPSAKALFLIDEFGTLGKLPIVADNYGLGRGLGLSFWTFVQDLNQLADTYGPNRWQTFLANASAVQFFHPGRDQFTANAISQQIGSYYRRTRSTSWNPQGGISVSVSDVPTPVMRPEELRLDLQDKCYVFCRDGDGEGGAEWHRLAPMFYFRTPALARDVRPLPQYLTPATARPWARTADGPTAAGIPASEPEADRRARGAYRMMGRVSGTSAPEG